MANDTERRSYFRLDDVLLLHYRVLNEGGGSELAADARATAPQVGIANLLMQIDREFNEALRHLWQAHPEAAKAIGLLNRKLTVIAQAVNAQPVIVDYEERAVNISGSGIAFECEEAIDAGTRMQLFLVLKPSQEELTLRGQVVSCDRLDEAEADKPRWRLRVDFEDSPDDQERLIQHIIQLQATRIAAARSQP